MALSGLSFPARPRKSPRTPDSRKRHLQSAPPLADFGKERYAEDGKVARMDPPALPRDAPSPNCVLSADELSNMCNSAKLSIWDVA